MDQEPDTNSHTPAMDHSGVYIVSHKAIDADVEMKKKEEPSGFVNDGFNGDSGTNYRNYDAPEKPGSDAPYRGMGKEDLLRHSSKPLWRRLRYVCMSIILLGWLALIITVVALVLIYPRCRDPRKQEWWQTTVAYRIYVPSFQDSDGDGKGDINGITQRLDYLAFLGVGTISLSPIYQRKSGVNNNDMDVTDHKKIDSTYGSLVDFQRLLNETHSRSMKLILDFIPNLTSDQHPWFQASRNPSGSRRNFYIWEDAKNGAEPNNWKSKYNNPSWTNDSSRGQYYLHQFRADQPDLNLRSQEVKEELQGILQYWLDLGVDGFYVRDSGYLFEDYDLRDNSKSSDGQSNNVQDYAYYNNSYTYGLREINDMLARWRFFLDTVGNATNQYRMLFADISTDSGIKTTMSYYGYFNRDGVDFPLNRFSLNIKKDDTGSKVANNLVQLWMKNLPAGRWANWMGGDEDSSRMAGRLGSNMTRAYLMMSMLLPGTPFYYYGDEIGMMDSTQSPTNAWDMNQPMRSPMRWDNSTNGGFINSAKCTGSCTPWMPLNSFTGENSVMNQNSSMTSLMILFKNLTKLRSEASFQYGDYFTSVMDDSIVSFVREYDGKKGYLVAINFGKDPQTRKYTGTHATIPSTADIELTTENGVNLGDDASWDSITLGPYQGVVVSWEYVAKEL